MTMLKILAMTMGRLGLRPYTLCDGPDDNDNDGNGKYNSDGDGDGSEYDTELTTMMGRLLIRPYTLMTLMLLTITMPMLMPDA